MNAEETTSAGIPRQQVIRFGSAAVAVVVAVGAFLMFSGPSDAESAKVVCAMRTTTDQPIIDTTKNNTREDLAQGLRDRAKVLDDAAGKTGGDTKDALKKYSSVMKKLADSIENDSTGASLADAVKELSENEELSSANDTLTAILDTKC